MSFWQRLTGSERRTIRQGNGGLEPHPLRVCLVTEGSYPYYRGGVSTWCDMLVRGLPEIDFTIVSLVADPSVTPLYTLPENVSRLIPVPLWGTGEVLELQRDLGLVEVVRRKRSAPSAIVEGDFLPLFRQFLGQLWGQALDSLALGEAVARMVDYFQRHDYDLTLRSRPVWDSFVEEGRRGYAQLRANGASEGPSLLDVTNAMRLLYRWLSVLTVTVPPVDVIHTASAGLCSLLAIGVTIRRGTPFLLTEHGIYLRERLLALSRTEESDFEQLFQARFAQRITEASYAYAQRIAPGSDYNHRWEIHNGAAPRCIRTIYNGPDPAEFTPVESIRSAGARPTIVWLGRIDPLKDLETLIRAAARVRVEVPEARFVLYGKAPKGNEAYHERCLALRDELGLEDTVVFAGFAASAEAAFNEGDFVVLSSISEGFPYSVVEAMMCGRTVVGTDVGGVAEALEGCGIVVEPRNPTELAEGCLRLLRNPALTRELGRRAREKALSHFSLQQCNAAYLTTYQYLVTETRARCAARAPAKKLQVEVAGGMG